MSLSEGIAALYLCSHCIVEGKRGISHSACCWIQSSPICYQFQQFLLCRCGRYGDGTSPGVAQDFPWIETQEKICLQTARMKDKGSSVPAKWIIAWEAGYIWSFAIPLKWEQEPLSKSATPVHREADEIFLLAINGPNVWNKGNGSLEGKFPWLSSYTWVVCSFFLFT